MKKQIQAGFTLIELIVVIVILGILAAVAVPKFVDLSADARKGVMLGVEGAMRGANTMLYGKAAAAGNSNATGKTVTLADGTTTVTTNYGYAATQADLMKAVSLSTSDVVSDTTGSGATDGMVYHKGAKTPAKCSIKYAAPAAAGGEPTYTTDYSDC